MKSIYLLLSIGILIASCKQAPKSHETIATDAEKVTETSGSTTLALNTAASKVEWIGTKVSSHHTGTVNLGSGELKLNEGTLVGGNFTFDMKSILVTGPQGSDAGMNKKLNGHLLSPDFFDADKFPEAKFEITSVASYAGASIAKTNDPRQQDISEYEVANPTHAIKGNLTIKGVTRNIEFPAQVTIAKNSANAIAKFNIDRKQWNITYPGQPDDLIRDEIYFGVSIVAGSLI